MARTQGSYSGTTGPRVRKAAQKLFARNGYATVSMRQIAADVGVQAGALYNYTPDKQTLLFDLMKQHMDELLAARAAQDVAQVPLAALEGFTRFHIRFHLDRPDAVFIAYMELRNLTEPHFEQLEQLRATYEGELMAILSAGQVAGVFDLRDIKVASRAVIAMLTGVTTWYRDSGALSREDVEEIYWQMVRKAVAAT
ncbi:TetR/AcrR family transcriptional regulator [Planktotalea sp.]|uniref:TetR/AcrR family transcriptional regulator n=1 Tax=Planktotalea sp. TaxID=2029877 RepID=UPI0025EE5DAC|nr:TetR/AcrR family transcriptional regulator [Planktotalea sp.]